MFIDYDFVSLCVVCVLQAPQGFLQLQTGRHDPLFLLANVLLHDDDGLVGARECFVSNGVLFRLLAGCGYLNEGLFGV